MSGSNFCKPINPISETAIAVGEIVEKKVEYKVERKSEAERDLEDAADKARRALEPWQTKQTSLIAISR